ncbi:MAG: hypothetical protein FJX57_22700 [Alphaproteobacteria bacterium]|nr:hypothetical protein [Alphaproteobacteria bacterium]
MSSIRTRVRAGEMLEGAWLNPASRTSSETTSRSGFDWVLFDLDHGFGDSNDLLHQPEAIEASPAVGVVRVPGVDGLTFKSALDHGPAGLMIPNIAMAAVS